MTVVPADALLSRRSLHLFTCAQADGRPLKVTGPAQLKANVREGINNIDSQGLTRALSWSEVGLGMMTVRGGARAKLETNLLLRAQRTWMPQVFRVTMLHTR